MRKIIFVFVLSLLFINVVVGAAQSVTDLNQALFTAIDNWDMEGIKNALHKGADPNACYKGVSVINYIIYKMGDVRGEQGYSDMSLIKKRITFISYEDKVISMLEIVFESGAAIQDFEKVKIVHDAVLSESVRVTRYILQKGANPSGKDSNGTTAMGLAVKNQMYDMIALFEEYGVSEPALMFSRSASLTLPDFLLSNTLVVTNTTPTD